ncbi:Proline dehydrogenase family protein [Luminiphilus syltensis NOR5-1B]|uniref:Bifunctional protein PutA n=1 Tax=Luminiphilus syltensis NOR5-1B TaxID=565045 RepID=B8KTW3_9GAMM|nr:bifunctional proline dehydrogenase/L-glutamate gamma-semialdehyde dehydrogenase PutA [Luminiphilus syltensis]EED36371.1 Proline dehydrogenase family protein [Luminiphilus syltensis NOR5-1B]
MNQNRPMINEGHQGWAQALRNQYQRSEVEALQLLISDLDLDAQLRADIVSVATGYVDRVRNESSPSMMEAFLAEYGLSTAEGVGLMCLAEALLRVPDADTIDELIHDKIEPSDWGAHLGRSSSSLVNTSTWALMLTGKVLNDDPHKPAAALRGLIRRAGEPLVRNAVRQSMRILGRQFVLGRDITEALDNARSAESEGYTYSYDMLGEAARTDEDALRYHRAYRTAITAIAARASGDVRSSPGISVKLSALHPRYETTHRKQVMAVLLPRLRDLAFQAAQANIGFNIDAEEQDRLELSLELIEHILADPDLPAWSGFGVVVQAYGLRATKVIHTLDQMARKYSRRIMIRLVKGAYWDSEIKLAQEAGIEQFPVFTRKQHTDVSYLACAKLLLERRDVIYPQFATHNAHSCAAVIAMAGDDLDSFEFQRLHGMGESLHEVVRADSGTRCRIYAPVGAHRDLLAYLVRRLLENGANSSFVNQIVDTAIEASTIARDPLSGLEPEKLGVNSSIRPPSDLFLPERKNSRGYQVTEPASIETLRVERERWFGHQWSAGSLLHETAGDELPTAMPVYSPADPHALVGHVSEATQEAVERALSTADVAFPEWSLTAANVRANALRAAADLYEANTAELSALTTREAGKSLADSIAEIREAVDFLRFYACEAERLQAIDGRSGRGIFVCISPWNFPLAIFTGQIAAALAAGNTVIAKPAEQTPLIAARAVELMLEAGIPRSVLQLLPGDGARVGGALTADPRVSGVCFTGSTEVAQLINRTLAETARPDTVLIAETGGLNAMIVDSTALTEQAVRDIVISAFQSAGQRCSALRMLYVQEEARERLLEMLYGAMEALTVGDPWLLDTDVSPVIDAQAQEKIVGYLEQKQAAGKLLKSIPVPDHGYFVPPSVIAVDGIEDLEEEIFGPVLHVASFKAQELDAVVDAINATGYGLTFGLHTRIDDRVQQVVDRIRVGNAYVNRNQIGAIVGSQPFGGEGLSGTGPKAGGPRYVDRFRAPALTADVAAPVGQPVGLDQLLAAIGSLDNTSWAARFDRSEKLKAWNTDSGIDLAEVFSAIARSVLPAQSLPGPTGESNRLTVHPRGPALCLGPTPEVALIQAIQALAAGCAVLVVVPDAAPIFESLLSRDELPLSIIDGVADIAALSELDEVTVVAAADSSNWAGSIRKAMASREGAIVPLTTAVLAPDAFLVERHLCIDTTAAGGNASLLASVE